MAGSYKHLVDDDGDYRRMALIENMRDATEAIDELFFIIRSTLSQEQIDNALGTFYACSRGERPWPAFMSEQ